MTAPRIPPPATRVDPDAARRGAARARDLLNKRTEGDRDEA